MDKRADKTRGGHGRTYCETPGTSCFYGTNDVCINCGRKKGWRMMTKQDDDRIFHVDGFGTVGLANLIKFVPSAGEKSQYELKVGESTLGRAGGKPEKVTRVK